MAVLLQTVNLTVDRGSNHDFALNDYGYDLDQYTLIILVFGLVNIKYNKMMTNVFRSC